MSELKVDPSYKFVPGVLTFTTHGVPHYEIEERYWHELQKAYKRGLKDGQKVGLP